MDLFVKMVTKDRTQIPSGLKYDNLTNQQKMSMKKLKGLEDVEYKAADKGGNIVIWPRKMYEAEAYGQLRNSTNYTHHVTLGLVVLTFLYFINHV